MKRLTKLLPGVLLMLLLITLTACGDSGRKTQNVKLKVDKLSDYIIVRQNDASEEIVEAYKNLQASIKTTFGADLELKKDTGKDSTYGKYEILIGDCDRDEVRTFASDMKLYDWGYTIIDNKLIIYGGSNETTLKAIQNFSKYIIRQHEEGSDVFFDNITDTKVERSSYTIDAFTLQGSDIKDYTIVYPEKGRTEEALANWIASNIQYTSGYTLKVTTDAEKATGKEILVGTTNRKDCSFTTQKLKAGTYLVGADKTYVCARGKDEIGTYYAVKDLIDSLMAKPSKNQKVKLAKTTTETVPAGEELTAMTFNVYVGTPTAQREASVLQTILKQLPDTLGVQEANQPWMTYLNKNLGELYDYVGEGTDGGTNGTYSAIFYRKDRFEAKESGTYWLSHTPFTISRFPESSLNRNYSYALLLDKRTDKEIMVINTHLEHTTADARNLQIEVLLDFVNEYPDCPIVLTGDFNDNPASQMYQLVAKQLTDTSTVAKKVEKSHTFHNYGAANTLLDYVFVSPDDFDVSNYKVIKDKENGMLPSDHFPVIAKYKFK